MKAHVRIRAFLSNDIDVVVDLLQDVSAYRPDKHAVSTLAQLFTAREDCYACVATRNSRLIAFGSVFILNRVRGGRTGIIEDVVVAEDERGKGVGRQIVHALVTAARERGCFKVSLETSASAKSFYEANGFESGGQTMRIFL